MQSLNSKLFQWAKGSAGRPRRDGHVAQVDTIRYKGRSIYQIYMDYQSDKLVQSPTLTDYSFVQFRPTHDLYELLLSDRFDRIDLSPQDYSYEKQPTKEGTLVDDLTIGLPAPPSPQPKPINSSCNCMKSKCKKNYCECFRSGKQCSSDCSCVNCNNSSNSSAQVAPQQLPSGGCNCRKTHCLKRYCECHSKGVKCTSQCNCVDCENTVQKSSQAEECLTVLIDEFYL